MADHWHPYPRDEEEARRAQARSHAETFGEDLGPDPFADLGPSLHPDDKSTAARMAGHVERQRQEAATARAKLAAEIRGEIEAEKHANPYRGVSSAQLMGRAYLRHGRGQNDEEGNQR